MYDDKLVKFFFSYSGTVSTQDYFYGHTHTCTKLHKKSITQEINVTTFIHEDFILRSTVDKLVSKN